MDFLGRQSWYQQLAPSVRDSMHADLSSFTNQTIAGNNPSLPSWSNLPALQGQDAGQILARTQPQDGYAGAQYRTYQNWAQNNYGPQRQPMETRAGWLPPSSYQTVLPSTTPWGPPQGITFNTPDGRGWAFSPTTGRYAPIASAAQAAAQPTLRGTTANFAGGLPTAGNVNWQYLTNPQAGQPIPRSTGDINPYTGGPSVVRDPRLGSFTYGYGQGYMPYQPQAPQMGSPNPAAPQPYQAPNYPTSSPYAPVQQNPRYGPSGGSAIAVGQTSWNPYLATRF